MLIHLGEWCNPSCIWVLFGEIVLWLVALLAFGLWLHWWLLGSPPSR